MKTWLFLLLASLSNLASALPIQERQIDPVALSQLTSALGIPEDADLISATQQRWLRHVGQERWEMAELSPSQRAFVLQWAEDQALFAPWTPFYKTYDKALILGATTSHMQKRLDYLRQLWEAGVHFNEIVWLTGDRPLDSRVDGLTPRCKNESEAAHIIWEEANLPEGMRALTVTFVAVPMMKGEGSSSKRPNTEDTLVAWLQTAPQPCTALFVSDQPFCGYQFAVIKATLPDAFAFDVVGPGATSTKHPAAAAIILDSIARWIYQDPTLHIF